MIVRLLFTITVVSLALIIWSGVAWNLYGYDFPLWPNVLNVAAIAGWFIGWLLLVLSFLAGSVILYRRRRL